VRITASRKSLHAAAELLARVVPKKTPKPILLQAHLEATTDGALVLRATDLDHHVSVRVPATVSDPGRATAPALQMRDLLKGGDGDVVVSSEAGSQRVQVGAATVVGEDPDQFPEAPRPLVAHSTVSLDGQDLRAILKSALVSCCRSPSRYAVEGIRLERSPTGDLLAVATDGRRISMVGCAAEVPVAWEPVTVDPGTTHLLAACAPRKGDAWTVSVDEVRERLSISAMHKGLPVLLRGMLLVDRFPDYSGVLPKGEPHWTIRASAEALVVALDAVKPCVPKDLRWVRLSAEGCTLVVTAETPGTSRASAPIEGAVLSGVPAPIMFRVDYLLEAFRAADGDEVTCEFRGSDQPARLVLGKRHEQVIMPISEDR